MTPCVYQLYAVEKHYGGRPVLRVAHFDVPRGEIIALVGPSGAGKSTLLRLLALVEPPSSGSLTYAHRGRAVEATDATVADRRNIAMVFQRPALLSRSVRHNVAYGLRVRGVRDVREAVDDALARVSLAHLADVPARTLSGGEAQRVALARALVLQPDVLLLDEPTANLDPYNVGLIETLMCDQNQRFGTTVIVVTHNIFQARRVATRVGLVLRGELAHYTDTHTFFEASTDPRVRAFVSGDYVY